MPSFILSRYADQEWAERGELSRWISKSSGLIFESSQLNFLVMVKGEVIE
jgi:hypothetical protein